MNSHARIIANKQSQARQPVSLRELHAVTQKLLFAERLNANSALLTDLEMLLNVALPLAAQKRMLKLRVSLMKIVRFRTVDVATLEGRPIVIDLAHVHDLEMSSVAQAQAQPRARLLFQVQRALQRQRQ